MSDRGRSAEEDKQLLLDGVKTGSIGDCDTQTFDEFGNWVADHSLQEVR